MYLTRHRTPAGPRWSLDGHFLPPAFNLGFCSNSAAAAADLPAALRMDEQAEGALLAPLDPTHEVWAAGVTYLRSRNARQAESKVGDVYERVYNAERPELFFKSMGWRVSGQGKPIHIRARQPLERAGAGAGAGDQPLQGDRRLLRRQRHVVQGYRGGESALSAPGQGLQPLMRPRPGIVLAGADELRDLPIGLTIQRGRGSSAGKPARPR